jgi:hypothetical protein
LVRRQDASPQCAVAGHGPVDAARRIQRRFAASGGVDRQANLTDSIT